MIKIVLCGIAGRMGREIISAVQAQDGITIIAGVEAKGNQFVDKKISDIKVTDDVLSVIIDADCVVDFTNHTATLETLRKVRDFKKPFVTGTTGFSEVESNEIQQLSSDVPVFMSSNMSVGVNHMYNLVRSSTKTLADFDIEVIETHHRGKKDAPSGTAKTIAKIISEIKPETKYVYGREGLTGERNRGEVGINAVRGGDVVGEHRVLFLGNGEFIELRHYATSRQCFASGTLAAVRFITGKPAGLYGMRDLLGKSIEKK